MAAIGWGSLKCSLEAFAPQMFKCISIMRDSNGDSTTVRSRGGVLSREGPFSEDPLYVYTEQQANSALHFSIFVCTVLPLCKLL